MTSLLRLCGVALLAAIAALLVKRSQGGQAGLVAAAGLLLLLSPLLARYGEAVTGITALLSGTELEDYAALMLKALGIGLTVRITGDVCRDLGEETLAGGLELAGRLEILLLCLPLMKELLALLQEVMG